jgi:hypothetical protein
MSMVQFLTHSGINPVDFSVDSIMGGLSHREIKRDVLNIRSTLTPVAGKFVLAPQKTNDNKNKHDSDQNMRSWMTSCRVFLVSRCPK